MPTGFCRQTQFPTYTAEVQRMAAAASWYSDFDLRGGFCETQKYSCAVSFFAPPELLRALRIPALRRRELQNLHFHTLKLDVGFRNGSLSVILATILIHIRAATDEEESIPGGSNCVSVSASCMK